MRTVCWQAILKCKWGRTWCLSSVRSNPTWLWRGMAIPPSPYCPLPDGAISVRIPFVSFNSRKPGRGGKVTSCWPVMLCRIPPRSSGCGQDCFSRSMYRFLYFPLTTIFSNPFTPSSWCWCALVVPAIWTQMGHRRILHVELRWHHTLHQHPDNPSGKLLLLASSLYLTP